MRVPWAIRRPSCWTSILVSESSQAIAGRYFDGRSTRPLAVSVQCEQGRLNLSGELEQSLALAEVSISERLGTTQRRILLLGGAFVEVPDAALWDQLPQQWGKSGNVLAWFEARWRYVVLSLVGIVVSCWLLYVYALPVVIEKIADRVPESWVQKLSASTLEIMDQVSMAPSKLPLARQQAIRAEFARWVTPGHEIKPAYQLHFRDGTHIGPNAFALPSGDIVITDQLIEKADRDQQILGVLAHELGHLKRHHGLRQTLQSAMVALAANVLLGDGGDVTGASAALLNLRYSRDFEREADAYALDMMRANHVDPLALAEMLEKIDPHGTKDGEESKAAGYLSTHPLTAERIRMLKQGAVAK